MKSLSVAIQMKATEEYPPVVLFIILYKVVISSESVDEIVNCGHSRSFKFKWLSSRFPWRSSLYFTKWF